MKTAFKILPETEAETSLHLMIEIGWENISFVYYAKNPFKVQGLSIYSFEKNITAIELAEELTTFFGEEILPAYSDCYICYSFKQATLIPATYYKENMLTEILDCLYGKNNLASYYTEAVIGMDAIVAYRVDNRIEAALKQTFSTAELHHSLSLQLPFLHTKADTVYCIVYQSTIKVVLFKNHTLQIAQYFEYTSPADVAYALLNVCTQQQVSTQECTLILSGFIDKKSNLYDELYRYFLNIKLDDENDEALVSQAISQYPAHFFSHLILLAKCVS